LRHFICLSLLAAGAASAGEVALIGVIGDKAAVLAVDGGEPKTVKVGQTWNGIKVLAVEKAQASVEIEGKQRLLPLGQHYRGAPPPGSGREMVVLAADPRGHFFAEGRINGVAMRFIIDTGASTVVLSAEQAARAGIDWSRGRSAMMQTASGPTIGHLVRLDRFTVGAIELTNVEGVVLEQGPGAIGLLGMSFLNRVEMKRDGDTMTLTRRF